MKVLIIEDEELAADTLRKILMRINPNIEILDTLATVEAAVAWLSKNTADLLFMDIHLGDGESFQIFRQVVVDSPVIFTSAYDQYTFKAFKNQGIDYLLKPFDEEDVRMALAKLSSIRKGSDMPIPQINVTEERAGKIRNRFMVKLGMLIKTVQAEEVAYFMAEDKYLFLVTNDKQNYIIEETIGSLEPQLDPATFFKINRKFIINIGAIKEMYKLSRNRVRIVLTPAPVEGTEVVVSEERADAFKNWLNQ